MDIYNCHDCPFKTKWQFCMNNHSIIHGFQRVNCLYTCTVNINNLICFICKNRHTSSFSKYLRHITSRHKVESEPDDYQTTAPYSCVECGFSTYWEYIYKDHFNGHKTNNIQFQCTKCKFRCSHEISLRKHVRKKHSRKVFKCVNCNYKGPSNKLAQHRRTQHIIPKTVRCPYCARCFQNTAKFSEHIISLHSKSSWLQSGECDFKTKLNENFPEHMTSTDCNMKWLYCLELNCGFKIRTQEGLKKHVMREHYKCHQCPFCNETLKSLYSLDFHITSKHIINSKDEEWFHCPELSCVYKAKFKAELSRHIDIKHNNYEDTGELNWPRRAHRTYTFKKSLFSSKIKTYGKK